MQAGNRSTIQIVILTVLLAVLGFSAYRMWTLFNPPQRDSAPATAAAPATGAGGPQPAPPARGAAPAGAPVGTAAGKAAPAERALTFPMLAGGEVNSDVFRVYSLQPPKNPFLQKEEWYKEQLDQVPGYPELRDNGYFDSMEPVFPNIAETFGLDKKWASITLKRQQEGQASLQGVSKDGTIQTSIELTEQLPDDYDLVWTPESGIPLSALDDPGFVRDNLDKLKQYTGVTADSTDSSGLAIPGDVSAAGGLAIPGGTADATSGSLTTGEAKGDALACVGVNVGADKATALMYYNGSPYLVTAGSVLPTHYQVMEIKADGVVLLELRDGSSKWVPLSFSTAEPKT